MTCWGKTATPDGQLLAAFVAHRALLEWHSYYGLLCFSGTFHIE